MKKRVMLFFYNKVRYAFFVSRPTLFLIRDLQQKKINKRVTLFFQKKSEVRFFGYATYTYFDTQPTAGKNKNKEKDSQSTLFCVAPRVGVRDSQSTLCCMAPRVGVRVIRGGSPKKGDATASG